MKSAFGLFFIVLMLLAGCAPPPNQSGQAVIIEGPWARPASAGGNSAVYFTIDNPSAQADRLLGARSSAAEMVQVHRSSIDADGNSIMTHQDAVSVPSGEKVSFEPGGLHVMLMNLTQDLKPGQTLPVTLEFEKAGEVQVEATVREP